MINELVGIIRAIFALNSEPVEQPGNNEMLKDSIVIQSDYWEGSKCLENGVPWQVPDSIYKEAENCGKEDVVLELGTGGSTVFFAKRCKRVVAIETDPGWAEVVKMQLENLGLNNVDLICIPRQTDLEAYLRSLYTDDFTVFSIDTYAGYNRSAFIDAFFEKPMSKQLRMVVVDNYGEITFFPSHYDKDIISSSEWDIFEYNDEHWVGKGTRLYIRKN